VEGDGQKVDKGEFYKLTLGLKTAYLRFAMFQTDEEYDFWHMMLEDIPYDVAQNAIMEHMCTSVYPPSIAEIRQLCAQRCTPRIPGFEEAWGVVQQAKRKYGWYYPEEAFAMMDELTLSVVKNLGWTSLCQSENPAADRANFREAYEAKAKELQRSALLPGFVEETRARLKERYIPAVEKKEPLRLAKEEPAHDGRKDLTPEQIEKRERSIENVRRYLMAGGRTGGKNEEHTDGFE
jgi:hypothetical protein